MMPPRLRPWNIPSLVASCPPHRPLNISQASPTTRQFSRKSYQKPTQRRRRFYEWLNNQGRSLKNPLPHSTNYLGAYTKGGHLTRAGPEWRAIVRDQREQQQQVVEDNNDAKQAEGESADELEKSAREEEKKSGSKTNEPRLPRETLEDLRPFPLNQYFRSQPVLSEELREAIYQWVKKHDSTVPLASVKFGVSNERVGAVIRLKQMEKEWIAQGKTLAVPYSQAVLRMLPKTPYVDTSLPENSNMRQFSHEPINDLAVHPATRQQLFVPVAESRRFTRVDASKAFDNGLLPADERIPHPDMVHVERDLAAGKSNQEREKLAVERMLQQSEEKRKREEAARQAELMSTKRVPQRRWDFVFKDVNVDHVGRDGRDPRGVGWRYGNPHEDRKKDQVKIPTRVEA